MQREAFFQPWLLDTASSSSLAIKKNVATELFMGKGKGSETSVADFVGKGEERVHPKYIKNISGKNLKVGEFFLNKAKLIFR